MNTSSKPLHLHHRKSFFRFVQTLKLIGTNYSVALPNADFALNCTQQEVRVCFLLGQKLYRNSWQRIYDNKAGHVYISFPKIDAWWKFDSTVHPERSWWLFNLTLNQTNQLECFFVDIPLQWAEDTNQMEAQWQLEVRSKAMSKYVAWPKRCVFCGGVGVGVGVCMGGVGSGWFCRCFFLFDF